MLDMKMGKCIIGGPDVDRWYDGWREALIQELNLDQTDFLMRVLDAWQRSTPLQPYTNNPLGMPYVPGKTAQLLDSGYALFATPLLFRKAFAAFMRQGTSEDLYRALANDGDYAEAYRAIHALDWPATRTETDYPSLVLDMVSEPVRERLMTSDAADRKTSGIVGASGASPDRVQQLATATRAAASSALSASKALRKP